MNFSLMYEMRNPPWMDRPSEKFYAQVLEQIEWAEGHGFSTVTCPEHHGETDGYMPSPLTWAAAIGARTKQIRINIGLVVASLHHPVQLAEAAAIADIVSGGRLSLTIGGGYRTADFGMFGVPMSERGGRMTEAVQIIKKCWEEDSFDFEGKFWQLKGVRVRPKPAQKPRPPLYMGGASEAAARRAARYADGFRPSAPIYMTYYRDELIKLGKDPGPPISLEGRKGPAVRTFYTYVTRDPDRDWERIKRHVFWDWTEYSRFDSTNPFFYHISDPEEIRRSGLIRLLTPGETIELLKTQEKEAGSSVVGFGLRPAVGGMPIEMSQECLELVADEVMPHLK